MIVSIAVTSCNEDDFTGQSTMVPVIPFPGITITDLPVNVIMEEKDTVMEFTFTVQDAQTVDIKLRMSVDPASTATEGEDFELSATSVVIPAFTTTASFELEIFKDDTPEDDETIIINVGDASTANAEFEPRQMSIVLTNFRAETLDIEVDWNVPFPIYGDGTMLNTCEINPAFIPDIDPTVYTLPDLNFFSYSDDYSACPEEFTNVGNEGGWPDGRYLFTTFFWSNPLQGFPDVTTDYEVTVSVARPGVILGTSFMQREDQWFNSDDDGFVQCFPCNMGEVIETLLFELEIDNGVFKFYDPVNMDEILTARSANGGMDFRNEKLEATAGQEIPDISNLTDW
jgi:hypothetical protein